MGRENKKSLVIFLFIILPFLGFFLGNKYQSEKRVSPKTISDNTLLSDMKDIGSEIIVSDSETKFAVYLRRRYESIDYQPLGQDTGSLSIESDLVIMNLETGERKVFELSQGFIPLKMVEFLKGVTPEGGSHYRLHSQLLTWSPSAENVFWGKLLIYSNGDPPVANEVGYFKVDIINSKIDNFALPGHGSFGAVKENTNTGKVLYESLGDGLSLYLYDLKSNQNRLLVSYNKNIFDKYCSDIVEYIYNTTSFYGNCGRDRALRADWDGADISYFDFLTGKRVKVTTKM